MPTWRILMGQPWEIEAELAELQSKWSEVVPKLLSMESGGIASLVSMLVYCRLPIEP